LRYGGVQRSSRDRRGEDYRGWPLRQRLELLAFDARLTGVPQSLLEALWELIDRLPTPDLGSRRVQRSGPAIAIVSLSGEQD
jgi:hypothetical protein